MFTLTSLAARNDNFVFSRLAKSNQECPAWFGGKQRLSFFATDEPIHKPLFPD